jgi:eukaryotic-like serine/threonine-protein kinase
MSSETLKQLRTDAVLSPGETVGGSYRVDRLIAEGGMAEIWAGENLRTGKRVALKVIRRSFAVQSIASEMFRLESIAASKVNHPNVVNVFDVIDHAGLTLIVMELLQGETLAEYLEKHKPISLSETVMLLLPAMRGVAAAHAQGVIHRDLKPGNIFLCRAHDGSLVTTKVLDFGISKLASRPTNPESDQIDLARFGTPAYMSPEDIAGVSAVDARTDVYAFGVLLFESLTGRLPFEGQPSLTLMERILNDPAPKVRSLRPELPAEVESIIGGALAKKPEERFADVSRLIQAIEQQILPSLAVPRSMMSLMDSSLSFVSSFSAEPATPGISAESELTPAVVVSRLSRAQGALQSILRSRLGRPRAWVSVAIAAALLVGLSLWALHAPARRSAVVEAPRAHEIATGAPAAPPSAPISAPSTAALPAPTPAVVDDPNGAAAYGRGSDQAASVEANDRNYGPFEDTRNAKPARSGHSKRASGSGPRAGRLSASDF